MKLTERLVPFPPYSLITIKILHNFWSKIDRVGRNENDCWLWIGGYSSHPTTGLPNYGIFRILREVYKSHRVAYFFEHRQDPGELLVCHKCNNRLCVNHNHLELGTNAENIQYSFNCGRSTNKGQFHPRANFNDSEIKMIRESDERNCDLARRLGVHPSTISDIRRGKAYQCT